MKRVLNILILLLTSLLHANAQFESPAHFTVREEKNADGFVDIVFEGKIDDGWHVYSCDLGNAGPTSAEVTTEKVVGLEAAGTLKAVGNEISKYDKMFMANVRYFEHEAKFVQRYKVTGETYEVEGFLEYGACNDMSCIPPTRVDFRFAGKATKAKPAPQKPKTDVAKPVEETPKKVVETPAEQQVTQDAIWGDSLLWTPAAENALTNSAAEEDEASWLKIFLLGLLGGLLALFTPCVWPVIPMTVSFFLKRAEKGKEGAVRSAVTYGVAIVVIYLSLGLAVSLIWGASALNALATNAVFNIFLALLLVVFALSFFGWFELRLPSSWGNALDSRASQASGLLSIFLMAATLAIVSFSCTGPIIGFLLVGVSTSGDLMAPAIGMLGFALALSLPFTLFALFPSLIKRAPKSGDWMNIVKVSLGFIELAFALKFVSVADLAYGWRILDREVFLSLWIVIFGGLGLYLVGLLRFQNEGEGAHVPRPVLCIMLGLASLAFSIYLLPGLWGAPCKAVSAFAPPMYTQDFNMFKGEVKARYTDYEEGLAAARAEGKPALLDFTGFGCVNCRKMEATVWADPDVAERLNNDFVLISLFVDDKTKLEKTFTPNDENDKSVLRTVGDKWSYLQRHRFGANAQPFYVAVDADGHLLTAPQGFTEDVSVFSDFLNSATSKRN